MTNLLLWRLHKGWTQAEAAARVRIGLSTYGLLEKGRLRPSIEQTARLKRLFGQNTGKMLSIIRVDEEAAV